jgi:hypothetical protein
MLLRRNRRQSGGDLSNNNNNMVLSYCESSGVCDYNHSYSCLTNTVLVNIVV